MALSGVYKNFTDGTHVFSDGDGAPNTLTTAYEAGDVALSGMVESQRDVAMYLDRGAAQSLRHTNAVFAQWSMSFFMTEFSDATNETIYDFLLKQNSFSANVSTLGTASGLPYTVQSALTVEGTDLGDATDHVLTCDDMRAVVDFSEGDPNGGAVAAVVYGSITMT